ncbi:MAG: TnpV protein [Clostridia bacterium]|nr:TnpV protein [Clostridia bacterium]
MLGLTYHREGDYLIPDLKPPRSPDIGKYGIARKKYLKENHRVEYDGMFMTELTEELERVDREATEMEERLIKQMAQEQGVNEALKASDQMEWVRRMNNIRQAAEETVYNTLIYV